MHDDAAPSLACRQRAGDLVVFVELEGVGDFGPRPVERRGGFRPDQLGEIVRAERKARGRIHLPDETEREFARLRVRVAAARHDGRGDCALGVARARAACVALAALSKASSSVTVAPAPNLSIVAAPDAISPSARPLRLASVASFSAPSAIRSRCVPRRSRAEADPSINSPSAVKIAVGRSMSMSSLRARLGQAEVLAGAFGRNHENGGAIFIERDTRAKAHQRAAEGRAETAQPLQARRAAARQRTGEPRNLCGAGLARVEGQRTQGTGRTGIEDRGADGIGP